MHRECNQVCGTIHGPLSDTVQHVRIDVSGDRNRGVPEELRHDGDRFETAKMLAGGSRRLSVDEVIAHAAGQNWLVDNGGRVLPGEIYPEPDSSLRYAPMAGELPSRSARCSSSLALRIFP